jgi:large subunit ribosomal protein L4
MKVNLLKTDGSSANREIELDDTIFGIEPNNRVIYEDVRSYLANQRQGTASTKGRTDVRGGGKKAYRQKGTGMARRGSTRSPLLKGGGTVFGPKPRDYQVRLTKKMRSLARSSALAYKVQEEALLVVENFNFEVPKTKEILQILKAIGCDGKKVLLLTGETDSSVYKSARNIPGVQVLEANKPATYHILNADVVVLMEGGVPVLQDSIHRKAVEVEA